MKEGSPANEPVSKTDVGFFVELHRETLQLIDPRVSRPQALKRVLNREVCQVLDQEQWGICLGTLDLDGETAAVVKDISKAFPHIPFVMWVIGVEKGYWTNKGNVPETIRRTREVISWVNYYDLPINGLGFDSELPIEVMGSLFSRNPAKGVQALRSHWLSVKSLGEQPDEQFDDFLSQLKVHEGIETEAYLCFRPFDRLSPRMKQAGKKFSMLYPTAIIPRSILNGVLRVPGSFPAFGDVTTLKDSKGRPISSALPVGSAIKTKEPQEIARDIRVYLHSQGLPPSLRVFSLTGLEVIEKTREGLRN